jgi:superfamily II DNA helicase RecQ
MPYQFFTIPIHDDGSAAETLNRFIQTHQIANERTEFVQDGSNSAWVVCVCYIQKEHAQIAEDDKKPKVDYRELLSDEDFQVYAKLRSLRKELAEQEGVPPYALFTNKQLATMVEQRVKSASALRKIDGVGEARVNKYGDAFLKLLCEQFVAEQREAALNET